MYLGLFVYFKKHFNTFYQFLYSDKDNHYYLRLQSILTFSYTYTSWAISSSVLSADVRALCPLSKIPYDVWTTSSPYSISFNFSKDSDFFGKWWVLNITAPKYRKSQNKNVSLMSPTNCTWKMRFHVVVVLRQQATKNRESSLGLQNALFIIILPSILPKIACLKFSHLHCNFPRLLCNYMHAERPLFHVNLLLQHLLS